MKKIISKLLPIRLKNLLRFIKYKRLANKYGISFIKLKGGYLLDDRYTVNARLLETVINNFEMLTKTLKHYIVDFAKSDLLECRLWSFYIKTDLQSLRTIDTEIKPYLKYYKLKNKDVVLDMGAYHGIFSFYALSINPNIKIYAFEPNLDSYKILCENIKHNNIKNIIPINKANWNTNTILKFKQNKRGSQIDTEGISINTINISKFVSNYNIKKIDFVKMDIEGTELEVTKNMINREYIKNTNYAIASYHIINREKTKYKLESMFLKKGINSKSEGEHLTTYTLKKIEEKEK